MALRAASRFSKETASAATIRPLVIVTKLDELACLGERRRRALVRGVQMPRWHWCDAQPPHRQRTKRENCSSPCVQYNVCTHRRGTGPTTHETRSHAYSVTKLGQVGVRPARYVQCTAACQVFAHDNIRIYRSSTTWLAIVLPDR